MCEEEGPVVVGGHCELDVVDGLLLAEGVGVAGVVDEDVEFVLCLVDVVSEGSD